MTETKKKSSLLLPLGIGVLVAAGAGAGYWYYFQRQAGQGELPAGVTLIPQDSLMTFSLSTNEGQWQKFREFGTPETQAALDRTLAQWRDRLFTANGYNFKQDIQPWVGSEVTVAFLPPAAAQQPSTAPGNPGQVVAAVLPITNPLQAKQALEKVNAQNGGQWTERNYQGFQIRESQGKARNLSATVLDSRFLVITSDPKATDRVIDTYKGGASVAATPGFNKALGQIQSKQPFARLYINLPVAAKVASANATRPTPPERLAQFEQNQGLAATMTLEPEGIQLKGISWLKPNSNRKYVVQNTATNMPNRLPASTLIMASGGNLQRFWQDYSQGGGVNPISPINPEALKSGIQATTGLDLEKDLISWMSGEFSIALLPAPQNTTSNFPIGLAFLVQSNDRAAAERSLKQLDEAMGRPPYRFKVGETKVNDRAVTTWSLPAGTPLVTRGWLDGNVAFVTLGAPVSSDLIDKPKQALAENDLFKKVVSSQLNPNNGHFFIDVDRVASSGLPLFQLPPAGKQFISAIRSFGVTAAVSDERSVRYDVFALLRKGNPPGPLPSPTVTPKAP